MWLPFQHTVTYPAQHAPAFLEKPQCLSPSRWKQTEAHQGYFLFGLYFRLLLMASDCMLSALEALQIVRLPHLRPDKHVACHHTSRLPRTSLNIMDQAQVAKQEPQQPAEPAASARPDAINIFVK